MLRVASALLVVLLAAAPVLAQSAGSPSSSTRPASTPSVGSAGPDGYAGLKPSTSPQLLRFDDAIDRAATKSWDLQLVQQRVEQQYAIVQRAWSAVLPQLSAGASYTFNAPHQEAAFGSKEQLQQQALLFRSLGGLVAGAAAQNPDATEAAQQQQQAQALLAAANTLDDSEPQVIEITPYTVGNANLTLTVPLFSGAAIPGVLNARDSLDLVKETAAQSRAGVVLGVARAYYAAWTAQRYAQIADEQLSSTIAHRDLTKQQSDAGLITPLALQRAELDVVRAEQARRTALQTASSARANLGLLLGVVDDFSIEAPPTVPALEAQRDIDDLIDRAHHARPDLHAQELAVQIADRSVTSAWLSFLPSLSAQAQGRATTFTSTLMPSPLAGSLTFNASIPLFDGGQRWSQLRENSSRLEEERVRLHQLEVRVDSQVRGNADELRLRLDTVTTSKKALALAKATQETATRLYELGTATNLDVIDANLAVFAAELDEARAELDLAQGRLGLAYILGELRPTSRS